MALLRATTNGVLDRALDVAAALEVRGYGSGRRPPRVGRPWGRHDLGFALAAAAVVATALAGSAGGLAPFTAYPSLAAPADPGVLAVAAVLLLVALAPFTARRGVG